MAWGAKGSSGVGDLVKRLVEDDARLRDMHIMRTRKLDHAGVRQLCDGLALNTVCETFYASGHSMSPEDAALVGSMLQANKTLQTLCIGDENFGDDGLSSLATGLGPSCSLVTLDLENKGITSSGLKQLFEALQLNTSLRTLTISKNDLGCDALKAFSGYRLLFENLIMQGCQLTAAALDLTLVTEPLCLPSLKTLDLSHNPLGSDCAAGLAALLTTCSPTLRRLCLTGTQIGDEGAVAIAGVLASLTALSHLDASGCDITSAGIMSIGQSLGVQASIGMSLSHIILTDNDLKADSTGMEVLTNSLKQIPTLRHLEFGNCNLPGLSVLQLAQLTQLDTLSLFGNAMGDGVLEDLSKVMSRKEADGTHVAHGFCRLTMLSISGNKLGLSALETFLKSLADLPKEVLHLTELELGANPGCEEAAFEQAVNACRSAIPTLTVAWRASDIQTSKILPSFPGKENSAHDSQPSADATENAPVPDAVVDDVSLEEVAPEAGSFQHLFQELQRKVNF